MTFSYQILKVFPFLQLLINIEILMVVSVGNFSTDFDVTWGGQGRAKILKGGETITLSLDKESGSGFQSKNKYLFGNFHIQLKLVQGNSTGTVTAYSLWSNSSRCDEIYFGFLGNQSGDPYVLYTNVVTQSNGNREQQFYLWFDPTADLHTYSVLWNPQRIIFAVDGVPIRVFKNLESTGLVPYLKKQPMKIYCSIWSVDGLATRGGHIKIDWSKAPFTTSYKNFDATESCRVSLSSSSCDNDSSSRWLYEALDTATMERVRWVQNNYMIYSYCNDTDIFSDGLPPECDIIY